MDLLELAKQRRTALVREMSKLDQFVAIGEELLKAGELRLPPTARANSGEAGDEAPVRQSSAGGSRG